MLIKLGDLLAAGSVLSELDVPGSQPDQEKGCQLELGSDATSLAGAQHSIPYPATMAQRMRMPIGGFR